MSSSSSFTALWQPQAHMPSVTDDRVVVVGGDGAYLTTDDGRRLLDATAGLWHANVGHGRASIAQAAARQMELLETYHCFGRFVNLPALELAERVAALGPIADAKVFWTSGGSDSVDVACKLARHHWQLEGKGEKRTIVSRHGAYHGLHAFGTSIAGIPANRVGWGGDSLVPETLRVSNSDLAAATAAIEQYGPERIAAIVAEPVMGTGGVVTAPDGYLTGLQELCRAHDILLIADEVITGFGRTGTMFACERFDLQPDMVLMAKGITSGYAPLGGVLIAPRIAERFFAGEDAPILRQGITYSGHATACVVAQENLDVIEREGLVARAAELEPLLRAAVAPLAEHELVDEVRCGAGFMVGVKIVEGGPANAIANACIDRGVITRVLADDVLQICPPFVVEEADLELIGSVFAASLDAVAVTA